MVKQDFIRSITGWGGWGSTGWEFAVGERERSEPCFKTSKWVFAAGDGEQSVEITKW